MAIRVLGRAIAFRQLVAGELLEQEPIERLVGVESADHVIAIPPGERFGGVALVAVGLGIPDQVEPVPRPAFAVGGAGEQVVDHFFDRIRRPREVGEKCFALVGRWRQAGQVEDTACEERPRLGCRRGRPALFFEPGQHESIDRVARPGRVLHPGAVGDLTG